MKIEFVDFTFIKKQFKWVSCHTNGIPIVTSSVKNKNKIHFFTNV